MYLFNKYNIELKKIKFINIWILTYLFFCMVPSTLNDLFILDIFPKNKIIDSIGLRTIATYLQFSLIPIYFIKLKIENNVFRPDWLTKLLLILLFFSFFNNLLIQNFQLKDLLNISYHQSYHTKYLINIITFKILSNELSINKRLKDYCIYLIIGLPLFISLLFIFLDITGIQLLGVSCTYFEFQGNNCSHIYSRFSFNGINPNITSFLFTCSIALILQELFNRKNLSINKLIFTFISCFFLINGVILTGTRIGIIVIISCFILIFAFLKNKKYINKTLILSSLILGTTFFIRFFLLPNSILTRFSIKYLSNLASPSGRLINFIDDFYFSLKSPIFGSGIYEYYKSNRNSLPENIFLEIYIISGIVGLILILFIFYRFLKVNYYFYQHNNFNNFLLIPCLFFATITLNIGPHKIFWFILAVCNANIISFLNRDNGKELTKIK